MADTSDEKPDLTDQTTTESSSEKDRTLQDITSIERRNSGENCESSQEENAFGVKNDEKSSLEDNVKPDERRALITIDECTIDQIKGVLYGNCIGDAIGLLTEFMTKKEACEIYKKKIWKSLKLEYNMKVMDGHRSRWENGDWTDDSDQMILILRTLVTHKGKFDVKHFAEKLKHWVYHGYEELNDCGGCGLGRTTSLVLHSPLFLTDPHKAAADIWERSGRFLAPNGGVMRTSILGTLNFHDLDKVKENTRNACKVTHADPRCVASCVAVTIAIALMLQRHHTSNNGEQNVEKIIEIAHEHAEKEIENSQHKEELKAHMFVSGVEELNLDSPKKIGYTFKCMGAGFWALRQNDFRSAIQAITMEAGDADTNCAVAGALIGCKLGYKKLPQSWLEGLYHGEWLKNEVDSYLSLISIT